jgi:hypothetical protein
MKRYQTIKQSFILVLIVFLLMACLPFNPSRPTATPISETTPPDPSATQTDTALTQTPTVVEPSATPTIAATTPVPDLPVISAENLDKLHEVAVFEFGFAEKLDWSLDSNALAIKARESMALIDIDRLVEIASMEFYDPEVVLDSCADNEMVATTGDLNNILLYTASTGTLQHTIETQGILYDASFSPDGGLIAIPVNDEIAVDLYQSETGVFVRRLTGFETAAPVYGAVFSTSGSHLIWISRARVQPMVIETGALGPSFGHQEFVAAVVLSSDNALLAVSTAGTIDDTFTPIIQLWDANSGEDLGYLLPGDAELPAALDITPLGNLLVNAYGNSIQFWDLNERTKLKTLNGHADRVSAVMFSPDGRTLASAAADGTVRIWQIIE